MATTINQLFERLEQLEARITQLETALNNTVTFETLSARLVGTPENKKPENLALKKNGHQNRKLLFMPRW